MEIEKCYLIGNWSWDIKNDICAICKNDIIQPCTDCVDNNKTNCCSIKGKCLHCFHRHCILKWVESSIYNTKCPLCKMDWIFIKNEKKKSDPGVKIDAIIDYFNSFQHTETNNEQANNGQENNELCNFDDSDSE